MSDVGTGIFAKGRVVPEDVVALSVFSFACFGWCFLVKKLFACLQVFASSVLLLRVASSCLHIM